jgi:hypothetical protein
LPWFVEVDRRGKVLDLGAAKAAVERAQGEAGDGDDHDRRKQKEQQCHEISLANPHVLGQQGPDRQEGQSLSQIRDLEHRGALSRLGFVGDGRSFYRGFVRLFVGVYSSFSIVAG